MKRKLMTTAFATIMAVGLVSCASDKEKMEKQEAERQEEIREAEVEQQKMEEKARQAQEEADALRQEQYEAQHASMSDSSSFTSSSSDQPWANQQVSLDKVEKVQAKLNSEGFEAGAVDGLIGPNTTSAIKKFQESSELSASGELNQETIDAMGLDINLSDELAE